jgi:hypothetical protein
MGRIRVGHRWKDGELSIDEMVRRYPAGETLVMIAAAAGVSASTVRTRRRDAGVETRTWEDMPRRTHLELDDRAIIDCYRTGETTTAIAPSLGVSHQPIRERLIWAGVQRRPRGKRPSRGMT